VERRGDWEVNPHFVGQVRLAGTNRAVCPIVLICRSGNRSREAGETLEQHGFARVYKVVNGFEGPLNASHLRSVLTGWRHVARSLIAVMAAGLRPP